MTSNLTIWQLGNERIIAADNEQGRVLASEILGGSRAEANAAEDTGFSPDELTADQQAHLARHGWAPVE